MWYTSCVKGKTITLRCGGPPFIFGWNKILKPFHSLGTPHHWWLPLQHSSFQKRYRTPSERTIFHQYLMIQQKTYRTSFFSALLFHFQILKPPHPHAASSSGLAAAASPLFCVSRFQKTKPTNILITIILNSLIIAHPRRQSSPLSLPHRRRCH